MRVECIACIQHPLASDAYEIPCEPNPHVYCHGCLENVFRNATIDQSSFPPHCCGPISIDTVRNFLPQDLIEAFEDKAVEYTIPDRDRRYCFRPECAAFIRPEHINTNVATCQRCNARTCTICRNESHPRECPQDPEMQAAIDLVEANNWRRCPDCGVGIERQYGCNHMT